MHMWQAGLSPSLAPIKHAQVTNLFNKTHCSVRDMSFHLYTEHFIFFLQIYHITVNYAVFFSKGMLQEKGQQYAISLYLIRDLLGLCDNLTKQVGRTQKLLSTPIPSLILFIFQKLAANLHIFMIISQSFAGATNNEKHDLNRSTGIQFSVHRVPPPTVS